MEKLSGFIHEAAPSDRFDNQGLAIRRSENNYGVSFYEKSQLSAHSNEEIG